MILHNALKGIALMVGAQTFLPIKDGMAKMLAGSGYPPLEIVWAQFCIVYLTLAPVIVWRYGARMLWPRPLRGQIVRGIFTVSGIGFFYWAAKYIPLASTTAIYFLAPFVVTALSPIILKESVDLRRWIAVVIGFLGVFLILRPELAMANKGYLIAFAGGICIAFFYIFNRKLATGDPSVVMLAHSVVIGAVLLSFVVPFVWVPPKAEDVTLIVSFILCAIVGQGLLMASFKNAPASTVVPFQYTAILSATGFGFVMLGEFPDGLTWLGIAIVVSTGIYNALREGRVKKRMSLRSGSASKKEPWRS